MKIDRSEHEVIYNRRKNGESVMKLATEYGVKQNSIYRIIDLLDITSHRMLNHYKKSFEREKNIKRVKDLAEKYDIKIILKDEEDEEDEEDECVECIKLQDIILEKEKRIKELELELQKQPQKQIDTLKSQKNSEKEFWLQREYEDKTLNILKGYKTKSRHTKVKLHMLKVLVEENDFSFQDNTPERYQIKKLIQENENCNSCDLLKKYSCIYEDIIKAVWC